VKWICKMLARMEAQDAMVRECDCRPGRSLSTEGARTGAGAPSGATRGVWGPAPGGEGRGGAAIEGDCSEAVPSRLPVVSLTKFTHQGVVLAVPDDPVRSFT